MKDYVDVSDPGIRALGQGVCPKGLGRSLKISVHRKEKVLPEESQIRL